MSKRTIIYNDPRRMDLPEDFSFDTMVDNGLTKEQEILKALYDSVQINVPRVGETVNVKYVGISKDYLMFEAGFKDYLRVDNKNTEFRYLANTKIGESIDVYITSIDEKNFMIKGSISIIFENKIRASLNSLKEGISVTAYVREATPAGYSMDINYEGITLDGFMPNTLAGINRLVDSNSILGNTFEVMIESFSKEEGTYIVSRRKYLQSLIPKSIKSLKYGEVYTGHVTGTTDFGVFVEFNECLTGMVHKTNINPEWADRLKEITAGFEISFYIKEIIREKIILTQILRETIWDTIKPGQVLVGKVKDNKVFGSLVSLDDDTIGLIHSSEVEKSSKKPIPGEPIKVKVISVDRMTHKIFLSIS
jgi:ribosomal protein S1